MAKHKRSAPSYGKWWFDDWATSSLRKRLTPAQRCAYREFWDLCMSSPDPGRAVDGSGKAWSESEIAAACGVSLRQLQSMLAVVLAHGKASRDPQSAWQLDAKSASKSLPDHWKYKRLGPVSSDLPPKKHSAQTETETETEETTEESVRVDSSDGVPFGGVSPSHSGRSWAAGQLHHQLAAAAETASGQGVAITWSERDSERLVEAVGAVLAATVDDRIIRVAFSAWARGDKKIGWGWYWVKGQLDKRAAAASTKRAPVAPDAPPVDLKKVAAAKKAYADRAAWDKLPRDEKKIWWDKAAAMGAVGDKVQPLAIKLWQQGSTT